MASVVFRMDWNIQAREDYAAMGKASFTVTSGYSTLLPVNPLLMFCK